MNREEALREELDQRHAEIEKLERIIESRSRSLHLTKERLRRATEFVSAIIHTLPTAIVVVSREGTIVQLNPAACELLGIDGTHAAVGESLDSFFDDEETASSPAPSASDLVGRECERSIRRADGSQASVLVRGSSMVTDAQPDDLIACSLVDLTAHFEEAEERRRAQKLEAVGQLAAGIAHEINTPVQYVSDSLTFLDDACREAAPLVQSCRELVTQARSSGFQPELVTTILERADLADLEFVEAEVPRSIRRALEGVRKVAGIARAMRDYGHPGKANKEPLDVNRAIETSLVIARSAYKYWADVETDFAEQAVVPAHAGELNQVLINLIVNAAHAIEEKVAGSADRGVLRISTEWEPETLVIRVADDGVGIPEDVRARVFDPFFTTKEVGKGTGQGLALVHSIVVERHGGRLRCESEVGRGTTFSVHLPSGAEEQRDAA